ncbi:hypothetical protein P7K49_031815 [Saguinus oedipus]|uniref:Uncharacterized protein n=1 Tax=Saguinus oedipus TaxID=9490 RepID=A0ABQ9U0H3_SAGOE|nr:hypothetical protein P7K49_031815 [Saguinus oedipus]
MLLRVLPAVYEKQPQPINRHLTELLALMSHLEQPEQYHLLRLLHVAAKKKQLEVLGALLALCFSYIYHCHQHPTNVLEKKWLNRVKVQRSKEDKRQALTLDLATGAHQLYLLYKRQHL